MDVPKSAARLDTYLCLLCMCTRVFVRVRTCIVDACVLAEVDETKIGQPGLDNPRRRSAVPNAGRSSYIRLDEKGYQERFVIVCCFVHVLVLTCARTCAFGNRSAKGLSFVD